MVNENDAVADDEIRFGDNDRLAALVANLLQADLLVLLTDAAGLFTADPRVDEEASLVEEVLEVDQVLSLAGGRGHATGAAAAWRRSWRRPRSQRGRACGWSSPRPSGPACLQDAVAGRARSRHRCQAPPWPGCRPESSGSPSPWPPAGTVVVDAGAKQALMEEGVSLLPAGVREVQGRFRP